MEQPKTLRNVTPQCASRHLDVWSIKADWLQAQIQALKIGAISEQPEQVSRPINGKGYPIVEGIAIIELTGPLMKGWSKYGGTSTLWARAAIRDADQNKSVNAIMIHIDSPGGTSAGTLELGDEIARAQKPTAAHIDDLGASAAYWAASQADYVSMNRAGFAGSIGTYATIYDTSGAYEAEGIKVHVLSTGPFKGAGENGVPITEDQLKHWQGIVDAHFSLFSEAVRKGRGFSKSQLDAVADGRVFGAQESKSLGLIDGIARFEDALIRLKRAK